MFHQPSPLQEHITQGSLVAVVDCVFALPRAILPSVAMGVDRVTGVDS